ncbi:unnamed protein product [Urochloa humidicola]
MTKTATAHGPPVPKSQTRPLPKQNPTDLAPPLSLGHNCRNYTLFSAAGAGAHQSPSLTSHQSPSPRRLSAEMAAVLRGAKFSCARGLPLQHAAFVLLRGSSAMETSSCCIVLLQQEGRLRKPHQPVRPPAPGRATPYMNLPWRDSSHGRQMSTVNLGRIQRKSHARSSTRGFKSEAATFDVLTQLE